VTGWCGERGEQGFLGPLGEEQAGLGEQVKIVLHGRREHTMSPGREKNLARSLREEHYCNYNNIMLHYNQRSWQV